MLIWGNVYITEMTHIQHMCTLRNDFRGHTQFCNSLQR